MRLRIDAFGQSIGVLRTKMKEGAFDSEREMEYLLRYITRTRVQDTREALWGARYAQESRGIGAVIQQWRQIHHCYPREGGSHGRYCYHEFYSITDKVGDLRGWEGMLLDLAAYMSDEYADAGFAVVYAVHTPDGTDKHHHIHFAVNTINLMDGRKWQDFFSSKRQREERFNEIAYRFFAGIGGR